MKLTNEQIEHSIKSLSKRDDQMLAVQARTIKSYLSEILSLRKELEQTKDRLNTSRAFLKFHRKNVSELKLYIKQLEQDAERGESGVNGVV